MLDASQSRYAAQATIAADLPLAHDRPAMASVPAPRWTGAVAAEMPYPLAIRWFVAGVHATRASGGGIRALWSLAALAMLLLAAAAPALSLRALYAIRLDTSAGAIAVRRLLHLGVAVPRLFSPRARRRGESVGAARVRPRHGHVGPDRRGAARRAPGQLARTAPRRHAGAACAS